MPDRKYEAEFELPSAMVSAQVQENTDGTVFLYFHNEHGEYGLTLDEIDASILRAYLHAAEARVVRGKAQRV